MNQVIRDNQIKNIEDLNPIELLHFGAESSKKANGYLKVISNSLDWLFYFDRGKLIYVTNSIEPFERLDRHLRRLSNTASKINSATRTQVRLNFDPEESSKTSEIYSDYQAICWLLEKEYLALPEIAKLIKTIALEVFESYLFLQKGQYSFVSIYEEIPNHFHLEWKSLIKECSQKMQGWQALSPKIWSPYQRPYFFTQNQQNKEVPQEIQKKLIKILRGFNFRQLASLLDEDELQLATNLYPLIKTGIIILRNPRPPFDRLPRIYPSYQKTNFTTPPKTPPKQAPTQPNQSDRTNSSVKIKETAPQENTLPPDRGRTASGQKYKIACIDDSPTILEEINRFLADESISIFAIKDPVKALRDIIRIQPDLILLDVGMPTIDGYKLCRLVRNHSLFKTKPIIMVTGNKGIIDRAKARLAGATDYMTKPFTRSQLVKMVYKYLN